MSDLISRKALMQKFCEFTNGGKQRYLIPEEIWEMVELEPTAYDPDKIVEQLEELADEHPYKPLFEGDIHSQYDKAWGICCERVIEIVEKGGAV